jgi:uncharacterized Fe-S cluster-containing radical SAM superfamily protein
MEKSWLWRKTILRLHHLYLRGKILKIELTDVCNLRCAYCVKSLGIGVKGGYMDWDMLHETVNGFKKHQYKRVSFVGYGETLLYPKICEAIQIIRNRLPNAYISFNTNGTKLNRSLGKQLIDAGLNLIKISVNATSAEQYARINNSKNYDILVKNVQEFLLAVNDSEKKIDVVLEVFGGRISDTHQIQVFHDFWTPHLGKYGSIKVYELHDFGGQIDIETIMQKEEAARIGTTVEPPPPSAGHTPETPCHNRAYPCLNLFKEHFLSREGNALACCIISYAEQGTVLQLDSVKNHKLDAVYCHGKGKILWRKNMTCELYDLTPCNTCGSWKSHPNIWWRNPFYPLFGTKWF